jgi:hypothetical protein
MHGIGDEEDALDGVGWERLAGCWVDGFHCREAGCGMGLMGCYRETENMVRWKRGVEGCSTGEVAVWESSDGSLITAVLP